MRSAPRTLWTAIVALLLPALLLLATPGPARAQLMIIGHDEKVSWDDAGKVVVGAPGKDTVSIVDISNREAPRVVASLRRQLDGAWCGGCSGTSSASRA